MTSLSGLKAACEGLGYQTMVEPDELEIPRLWIWKTGWKTFIILPSTLPITPDLCDEMKQWLQREGNLIEIALFPSGDAAVTVFRPSAPDVKVEADAPTEGEALLACFLEVLKGEKS
jgi:hypothetical protein